MKPITTQKANCKDCHRCVRSCPAKAIGIEKGNARLIEEKCILCGKCVVECPQHAKQVESDFKYVKDAIQARRKVSLSLAPSFVSVFREYTWPQLVNALHAVGFETIEETAVGAAVVAQFYKTAMAHNQQPLISACCPVVVNLVTKYYPELINYLAGVVSPMAAHGRMIKSALGEDTFVVFAGPCIAKIAEARDNRSDVDAVITFQELKSLLDMTKVSVISEDKGCDADIRPKARYFPVPGGIVKSFMDTMEFSWDIVTVDGIENCIEILEGIKNGEITPRFVEALACTGGCIGGPVIDTSQCMPARRKNVMEYAKGTGTGSTAVSNLDFSRRHIAKPVTEDYPSNEQISEILRKTGKFTILDEKNCGGCGYNTCREKAIAVFQGIAETEMCVPYMRSKAESFANIIVDNSLNGIIVIDHNLVVQEFNSTAERLFNTRIDLIKGRSLAQIMDCSDFMYALTTGDKIVGKRVEYSKLGLITEQMIIPVREHGLVIAIISDVTSEEKRAKELQQMKLETAEKATEIIKKQMHVAQEIAGLLGETTAETKAALLELVWLLKDKEDK